jgi:RNA polymerase primary sigma factor
MNKKFINTKEDSISIYLKDVRKHDTIKQDEEIKLAKRISNGDILAIDELVTANLRFVISIAKEYQNQGVPLADLISEGNYGLITAAKRFDHTRGYRFISYAVWWIKQGILQCLNDHSRTVRLPANMINKMSKVKKEIERFEKNNHRSPSHLEVEYLNVPKCVHLSSPINENGDEFGSMLSDDIFGSPDEMEEENDTIKKHLENAMDILSERERSIVNCYFGINGESMTLESIGDEFDLTKERIRQIKEAAIRKIRNNVGDIFNHF